MATATAVGTGMEAMEGTVEAMVATEDTTTARGPLMLRLRLMLSPPPLPSLDMATTAMATDTELTVTGMLLLTPMDITATTARDLLMPSPPMGTTAMGTEVTTEDIMATVATEDTTTARGLLMLSQDMVTTAEATEVTVGATMGMVMVTATDTTVEKFQKFMIQSDLEF